MDSHHQAHLWPRFRFHAKDQPALSHSLRLSPERESSFPVSGTPILER
jgi:hypothetical protein